MVSSAKGIVHGAKDRWQYLKKPMIIVPLTYVECPPSYSSHPPVASTFPPALLLDKEM